MVDTFTTTSANTTAQKFYTRAFLVQLMHNLIYRSAAKITDLPVNNGKSVTWRHFDPLDPATTVLVEGVTPTGSQAVLNEVSATVNPYGDFIQISDEVGVFDTHGNIIESPRSAENVQLLTTQALETIDVLCRDVITAGTNVVYSGGVTSRTGITSANTVSIADFESMIQAFQTQKVKPVLGEVSAGVGQGTLPVYESYLGFVGPKTLRDLRNLDGFIGVQRYGNTATRLKGEVGALADLGIRFVMTSNDKIFSAGGNDGIDVHATVVLGDDAYGEVKLNNDSVDNISIIPKPFGSAGTADPLDQRATMGWKVKAYAAKILRQVALYRYEHAVTSS